MNGEPDAAKAAHKTTSRTPPELLLEPDGRPFKQARLVKDGIPFTSFAVDDVNAEAERLRRLGVASPKSRSRRTASRPAVFDDTCGNLIQIASHR